MSPAILAAVEDCVSTEEEAGCPAPRDSTPEEGGIWKAPGDFYYNRYSS